MSAPATVYDATTAASLAAYRSSHAASIRDTSAYWSSLAQDKLEWFAPFPRGGKDGGRFADGSVSWFAGGRLNVCHNAVDRYCAAPYHRGGEVAIIWEGDEPDQVQRITYHELRQEVCRIANAMAASGVKKVIHLCRSSLSSLSHWSIAV